MSVIIINEAFFDSFIRNDATFPLFLTPLPYGLRFAFWFPQLREHILQMSNSVRLHAREGGGGVLPYMGYIGTCRGIGYGF